MKATSHILFWWAVGVVLAFVGFCLAGAVYDSWMAPSTVNGMVGYAPGVPSEAGIYLLVALIPELAWMMLAAVFAVMLILAILGDAIFGFRLRRDRPPKVLDEAMNCGRFEL